MTQTLEEAMRIVRAASRTDPEAIMRIEMFEATKDVDFVREAARKPPEPSFAGQSPHADNLIAAAQASHAAMIERDRRLSAEREASREERIRDLAAGQSPASQALVRTSIANGG